MKRSAPVFAALVLIAGLPFSAAAQTGLSGISRSVRVLDTNFDIADKNRDGKLSKEEAAAGPVSFIAKNFDAIDTGHTGLVSKNDVHAYMARMALRSQPAHAASGGKPI